MRTASSGPASARKSSPTIATSPELRRNFALQAVFKGKPDKAENIKQRWDESREKRKATQPVMASAGCTFKNPEDIPAGRLIDSLGLKGSSVGNAAVSEVHGNFVVNQGGATAREILQLIESIQQKAKAERGVELETEVKILGEDEPAVLNLKFQILKC